MTAKPLLSLACALVLPAVLWADDEALDALAKQEQESADNEAVSVYGGKVGAADAIFFIEWAGTDSAVEGRYYLPARGKNVMHILKGSNPTPGVLELEEFLDDGSGTLVLNASCNLKKRISEGRIVWEGEKNYANGRFLPISFSRPK